MPDDERKGQEEKSIEMRVAELEDTLRQLHITEEEVAAFHKVSNALGGAAGAVPSAPAPEAGCVANCTHPASTSA
jgi:hypothetical protein